MDVEPPVRMLREERAEAEEIAMGKELSQGQSFILSRSPLDTSWIHASGEIHAWEEV